MKKKDNTYKNMAILLVVSVVASAINAIIKHYTTFDSDYLMGFLAGSFYYTLKS